MKALLQKYRSALLAAIAIGGLYLFFFVIGITCPIKFLTGISCAGCGMTRAWLHLIRLDITGAFAYHPLFWTVPIILLCFFLKKRFPRSAKTGIYIIVFLFIIVYFLRMFDHTCTVVVFEPANGAVYRIIQSLLSKIRLH